jgi:hypothetical protein
MTKPSAAQIREWSDLNFDRLGYSDDAKLENVIDRAVGYITSVTGIALADAEAAILWYQPNATNVAALMQQAIQMRVEQIIMQGRRDYVESAAQNEVIQSFSAGLYSESRRDPRRPEKSRSINTWPALDELLWMLMSPDMYGYWLGYVSGEATADWSVVGVDWNPYTALQWFEPWDRVIVGAESM